MRGVRVGFVLMGLVLFTSCLQGSPGVVPRAPRTLGLGTEDPDLPSRRPFGVTFAGPKGPTVDASVVTVLFNRPMHALEIAEEASPPPIHIETAAGGKVAGTWRWVGTHAARFSPVKALPRATEFHVTVPAGTRAVDGATMKDAYAFSFSTPRPELVNVSPSSDHLSPSASFELRFNQPVDVAEARGHVSLLVAGKLRAFSVRRPQPDVPELVQLSPTAALPLDTDVDVVVSPALVGMEGPLTAGTPHTVEMRTYGPLEIKRHTCSTDTPHGRCAAFSGVSIELTNDVPGKEFAAHARIEGPTVARVHHAPDYSSTYWTLGNDLRPAASYRLVIKAGMKDIYGQKLAHDVVWPFQTDDEWPALDVGLTGGTFEARGTHAVPVTSLNVAKYDLLTVPLDEAGLMHLLFTDRSSGLYDVARGLPGAKVQTIAPRAATNAGSTRSVALDHVPPHGRGPMAFGVRWPSRGGSRDDLRLVTITDLAITAKMSRFGGLVWVTRLSDARPVAGASVSIRTPSGEAFGGKTGSDGVLAVPADRYAAVDAEGRVDEDAVIVVRDGDDWAYRRMNDDVSPWSTGVYTDLTGATDPFGMLFADRGIYRPGDTVRLKGLVRVPEPRGTSTPRGREIGVTATDSQGQKLLDTKVKLGAFGDFALDIPTARSTPLGYLDIQAITPDAPRNRWGGSTGHIASTSVRLAEYQPSEFKVGVETSKPSYVRGDPASFTVHGDYLFGAPMGGAGTRYTVTRGETSFTPPGAEDLVVDDGTYYDGLPDAPSRATELDAKEVKLDAKGTFGANMALALPGQRGPEVVTVEAEVTDLTRQSIAGRSSVVVHPADFYVAEEPLDGYFFDKGKPIRVGVAAITPEGAHRAGTKVDVVLIRRTWRTILQRTGDTGARYDSHAVDEIAGRCSVTTTAKLAGCAVTPRAGGYYILRAVAKDAKGNTVGASQSAYVLGDEGSIGWDTDDANVVKLTPDRKSYEVGQTARILVKNPFRAGQALVTVERTGVYTRRTVKLVGPMPTIRVPITADLLPNAFVSVQLERGRVAPRRGGADVGAPQFRVGYTELSIDPSSRRLKVAVTPSTRQAHPGDQLDVALRVADAAGKPARASVTLYAVDEGVLMLTGYKTPDPFPVFTAPRPLAVFTLESRQDLAAVFRSSLGQGGGDKGGDGGGGGDDGTPVRSDFRTTALFLPSLVTGDDGVAHARFKLPDGLTTYRIMAVAAGEDDRFGFGQSSVTASRPLMARPSLPRFMRAGDTLQAGVVVSSKMPKAAGVDVTIDAKGVQLAEPATRHVSLPASGSTEVRWNLAAPTAGRATFAFTVKGGGESDAVRVTREISTPTVMEAVALYGDTESSAGERLGDLSSVRKDVGELDLRLSSTALVGLDDGVEQLVQYPYGCTEQLTSRLVPLVVLRDLARDYGIKLPGDVDARSDEAVAKILKNQRPDGGFGYWPDSPESSPWLTAYALWGLWLVQQHGHVVPAKAIEAAKAALGRDLQRWDGIWLAADAFVLDVLAETGSPDPGAMNRLYDSRDTLPLFARALLAHAMLVSSTSPDSAKELLRGLENHLRVDGPGATVAENLGDRYAPLLDSEARTTAMVLRTLLTEDPRHPLAARLAKGLLAMRKGGTWRSTQETAWALIALDQYRKDQEKKAPDFTAKVLMGGRQVASGEFHGRSLAAPSTSVAMGQLLASSAGGEMLGFQVQGDGRLFYEARLHYARKDMPTTPLDRGFAVTKAMRSLRPEDLRAALATVPSKGVSAARAGDLVLVDLVVVSADPQENVVIDDPLPAGLQGVDTSLETTASDMGAAVDAGGEGDQVDQDDATYDHVAAGNAFGSVWYHREMRDDRVLTFVEHMPAGIFHFRYLARAVTPGRFLVPPTKAEDMYAPEVFGRTAGAVFQVAAP